MIQTSYATEPTPGGVNEDHVATGPNWWLVLDGATQRPDVDSGCVHGPAWLARQLAAALADRLHPDSGEPLPDLLAEAIKATCDVHSDTCDLANPDSPSATVTLLRSRGTTLDWLVLADSPLVLDVAGDVRAIVDDRLDHLPSYTTEVVRATRNRPGGFWVASTRPEAAYEALTGSTALAEVRRAALLSDGAARLVERFGRTDWRGLLDLLDSHGPAELIRRTRAAERAEADGEPAGRRGKRHDDATAIFANAQDSGDFSRL